MSLPLPLAVRLSTARADRHITNDVHDLSFRSVVPGGFASCTVPLSRPLRLQPDEVALYGRLYVYDRRNGATVWEGRLEDPTRTAGADGEVWELSAVGPSAHTQDRAAPLVYVDRRLDAYERADNATPGGEDTTGDDPGGSGQQAFVLRFPQGLTVATNARVVKRYWPIQRAGMKLARYNYSWDAGRTSVDLAVQGVTRTDGGTGENSRSQTFNTAGGATAAKVVVTDFPNGRNTLDLRITYTAGGGTFADDTTWASILSPVVRAMLLNPDGSEQTGGYNQDYVTPGEVVGDLVGRLLPGYDGAGATIDSGSHTIDQMAYPDGVTPAQVLADVLELEPDRYWAAWESNRSTGKYRFQFVPWPTTVRYEASTDDGFFSPGSAEGLYNEARVRWKDAAGAIQTTVRTQTVPELDAAGLVRTLTVDLGDEVGSLTNAQRAGDQALAQHRYAPNAGTLVVARPIHDLVTGRMVMPWEIRPGVLVRVRGVLPRVDALNPTARDGVTTFRLVAADFSASSASASLSLDSSPFTLPAQLAAAKPARALAGARRR